MAPKRRNGDEVEEALLASVEEGIETPAGIVADEDDELTAILNQFSNTEGFYAKIYKRNNISGQDEMVYCLDPLTISGDAENYIRNLAIENDWGNGEFTIRILRHGDGRFKTTTRVRLAGIRNNGNGRQSSPDKPESDRLNDAIELIAKLKAAQGGDSVKAFSDAFTSGVQAAKTTGENGALSMKEIISLIKDKKDDKSDTVLVMLLEKMLNKREENPETAMIKTFSSMKELGIIPDTRQVKNPLDDINTVLELVERIAPGGGDNRSTLFRAVELIAPKLPEIIGQVTGPITQYLEIKKIQLERSLSRSMPHSTPKRIDALPAQSPAPEKEIQAMNPIVKKILIAVRDNDVTFYAELEKIITGYINPDVVSQMVLGEVAPKQFLIALKPHFPQLANKQTEAYLIRFIEAKREAQKPAITSGDESLSDNEMPILDSEPLEDDGASSIDKASNENVVIATCGNCDAAYEFDSVEEFNSLAIDERVCNDCGASLNLASVGASE